MSGSVLSTSNELDRLDRASTAQAFWRTFEEIIGEFGLRLFIYLYRLDDGTLIHQTNLPEGTYAGAERDPFLKYCCNNMGVSFVGIDYDVRYRVLTEDEVDFVTTAARGGWHAGLAIPVRVKRHSACGGFNLGSHLGKHEFEKVMKPRLDRLRALCLFAQRRIEDLGLLQPETRRADAPTDELTPRQRSMFKLLRQGLSRTEIAERTGISPLTVASHQKAIYRKLGVNSQRELMRLNVFPDLSCEP